VEHYDHAPKRCVPTLATCPLQEALELPADLRMNEGLLDLILGEEHQALESAVLRALDAAFDAAEAHSAHYVCYRSVQHSAHYVCYRSLQHVLRPAVAEVMSSHFLLFVNLMPRCMKRWFCCWVCACVCRACLCRLMHRPAIAQGSAETYCPQISQ
jgi:hypothetical protein